MIDTKNGMAANTDEWLQDTATALTTLMIPEAADAPRQSAPALWVDEDVVVQHHHMHLAAQVNERS